MRFTHFIVAAAAVTVMGTVPLMAQQKIYAFKSNDNFCPTGSQPVTINGEVSCGVPTENVSYQQVKVHPVAKHRSTHKASRASCPVGTKGCTLD